MAVVAVALSPVTVTVDPGREATCSVTLQNLTGNVQRLTLEVCGEAAAWTEVEASGVSLLPGQRRDMVVRFRPPREPVPQTGTIPFAVKVTPRDTPEESVVEEGDVVVNSFLATTAAIEPQASAGFRRARHRVRVHNGGNRAAVVELSATDPQQLLDLEVEPTTIQLKPGFVGQARLAVRVRRQGGGRDAGYRPFQVRVRTEGAATLTLDAGMHVRATPLPSLRVVGPVLAAVVALVLGGVLYAGRNARVRDATLAFTTEPPTTQPARTTSPPTTSRTTEGPATTVLAVGEAAAIQLGAPCRPTSNLAVSGKVLSRPDGSFVRQFRDEAEARAARDLLARHPSVCTIGTPGQVDALLTFYPPPIEPTPVVAGARRCVTYSPTALTKSQNREAFAVEVGTGKRLVYATEVERDRAFALLLGHNQICWIGGGDEDIFSTFFEWTTAITYF